MKCKNENCPFGKKMDDVPCGDYELCAHFISPAGVFDSDPADCSAEVLELKKQVAMYRTMCLAAHNEIMSEIEAHTDPETGFTCCNLLARLGGKIGPDIYPTWATDAELELFAPNEQANNAIESGALLEILNDYNLQYHDADNGEPCLLVDALSPDEDNTIYRGKMELELLAEHIAECLSNKGITTKRN